MELYVTCKTNRKKNRESHIKFFMERLITYESVRCTGQFPKFSMTKYSVNENLSGKKFVMLGEPQKIREIRKKGKRKSQSRSRNK
jgi:hypothetical protein